MTIKHIVLGGGGPFGLVAFGALKYLHDTDFWNIKDIKSIYATSVGALMSVYLTIGYDYDYIYDYFVKRPWGKIFNDIGMDNFIDFYNKRGLIDIYPLLFRSINMLLEAKGLSPNITMKEYYDYCGIELYFIATEINDFNSVVLSHKTHPDIELITAICMTGSFPGVFRPVVIDDKCYTDGGIFCNYPIKNCLDEMGCNANEILGIRKINDDYKLIINNDSTFLDFFNKMILNMIDHINCEKNLPHIPYDIECDMNIFSDYESWVNIVISTELRIILLERGASYAKTYSEKWIQQNIDDCGEGVEGGEGAEGGKNGEGVHDNTTLLSKTDHESESISPTNEEL